MLSKYERINELRFPMIYEGIEVYLSRPVYSESCIKIKINLNFCFHTSLWGLKSFWGTTKKCENKNLSDFFFVRDRIGKG